MARTPKTAAMALSGNDKQAYLYPLLVVPANVRVDHLNELLHGRAFPIPRIEQLVLEAAEEALAGRIVM